MKSTVKPHTLATPDGWYAGTNDEFLNIGGPFATREEAIAAGKHDCGDDPFYICFAGLYHWSAPDASDVMDQWIESSDDLWFEYGFEGFIGPDAEAKEKAAQDDLQNLLNDWFNRHHAMLPTPNAFAFHRDGEWIKSAEEEPSS